MRLDLAHLSDDDNILLNRVAEDIREPYNALIAQLSEGRTEDIDWIVSSIASRSIFLSPLVWHCYYLGFIRKKLEQGSIPEEIIVHDSTLASVVRRGLQREYPSIRVQHKQSAKQRAKKALKPLYQFSLATRLLRLYAAARRFPTTSALPLEPLTLIDTFVLSNSFTKGDYSDRYYPGMREALSSSEEESTYYAPTFIGVDSNYGAIIQNIRRSSVRFLLKEDVLQPEDYRFAFTHRSRCKRLCTFRSIDFLGFDIAPLINSEILYTAWDPSTVLALLIYRFVGRLRERGVRLRLVVDWFENQVIDRALNAGLREHYPEVPTVGYSGYIVSGVYNFYVNPTEQEYTTGVVPKECGVIGTGHCTSVAQFYPELPVVVAPAYRFSGVWKERSAWPDASTSSVLIALPITLHDCMDILRVVLPFASSAAGEGIHFRIKAHPSLSSDSIRQSLGVPLPPSMEFVDGDFNTWVERSHVLVGNTSSTCVEALAKGIPVVVIGSRNGITQNPIPPSIQSDIWTLCYTPDDVAAALERYIHRDEATLRRHEETGRDIRSRCFEPVTTEGTRRFLKL